MSEQEHAGRRVSVVASIARVTASWLGLGVLIVASIGGIACAGARLLQMKRAVKSLRASVGAELEQITRSGERSAKELETATRAFRRLNRSLLRLRTARARMRVISTVLAEAQEVVAKTRALIPSK